MGTDKGREGGRKGGGGGTGEGTRHEVWPQDHGSRFSVYHKVARESARFF